MAGGSITVTSAATSGTPVSDSESNARGSPPAVAAAGAATGCWMGWNVGRPGVNVLAASSSSVSESDTSSTWVS